jgi:hypothetical protein
MSNETQKEIKNFSMREESMWNQFYNFEAV